MKQLAKNKQTTERKNCNKIGDDLGVGQNTPWVEKLAKKTLLSFETGAITPTYTFHRNLDMMGKKARDEQGLRG